MEVQETGLQAKPGFAVQTWPAGGKGFAGQTGSCWPNWGLLAKRDCRPNWGLLAKRDCRPNGIADQTGFAGGKGFAGQTGSYWPNCIEQQKQNMAVQAHSDILGLTLALGLALIGVSAVVRYRVV